MSYLEWAGFFLLTMLDLLTATMIFFCALNERMLMLPAWYRIGLILTALGFAAQVVLNAPFLLFGTILLANELPFWVLKDMGIGMVASHYFWQVIKDRRKLGAPLEKKTAAKPARPRVRKPAAVPVVAKARKKPAPRA